MRASFSQSLLLPTSMVRHKLDVPRATSHQRWQTSMSFVHPVLANPHLGAHSSSDHGRGLLKRTKIRMRTSLGRRATTSERFQRDVSSILSRNDSRSLRSRISRRFRISWQMLLRGGGAGRCCRWMGALKPKPSGYPSWACLRPLSCNDTDDHYIEGCQHSAALTMLDKLVISPISHAMDGPTKCSSCEACHIDILEHTD